ncbi:hypothetical protein AB672_05935 [Xylella taiwanensis]|nr:hypothetical protein AB672_05935 [Xylella taiwanensis]
MLLSTSGATRRLAYRHQLPLLHGSREEGFAVNRRRHVELFAEHRNAVRFNTSLLSLGKRPHSRKKVSRMREAKAVSTILGHYQFVLCRYQLPSAMLLRLLF